MSFSAGAFDAYGGIACRIRLAQLFSGVFPVLLDVLLLVAGLAILLVGAEALVRGAASVAAMMRISPLVVGLTVVSFGTSAPELTVNLVAAAQGSPDIAIGNVVGSNIANILLILGITALIRPLTVQSTTVWKEIPLAFLAMVLLLIMGNDRILDGVGFNALTRTDGLALMALFAIFMYYIYGLAKTEAPLEPEGGAPTYGRGLAALLVVAGLAGLVAGGRMLVVGATGVASAAGLSEALIGLTVVAIGTSLPELATSGVAAYRGHADIAIGNVIGSNIFNVFWILGLTSTLMRLPFNPAASIDVLVGIGATLLLFLFMFIGGKRRLVRWEGGVFLVLYATYLAYLITRG